MTPGETGQCGIFPGSLLWRAFDVADVGLLITGADRRIVYVNQTFTRETGYTLAEVRGQTCRVLQGPGTDPEDIRAMRAALDRGEGFSRVVLNYHKDGTPLHYRVRVSPVHEDGQLRWFIGVQEDHTAAHLAQRRLERWAYVDSLTGLGNRRAFDQAVDDALSGPAPVQLTLLDLNDFKRVNDQRGHQAGDALLIAVAERLRGTLPAHAQAFRLGGDEFAVVVRGEPVVSEDLLEWQLAQLDEGQLRVAIGSAAYPSEAGSFRALFRLADQRLYARKDGRGGRGGTRHVEGPFRAGEVAPVVGGT